MNETIQKCACGQPVDAGMVELAKTFPKLIKAEHCTACLARMNAAEAAAARAERDRLEQARRTARLEIIPPEMRRTQLHHPDFNAGLWVRVEGWQPSALQWLGLLGLPGGCKTRCLALLVRRLIMDGHQVLWTTALEFQDRVDELRSDERGLAAESRTYLRRCKSASILVLDDLGKNTWTPTLERHLFDVIDRRKTHDLPVLWSANTHPVELLRSGQLTKDRAGALIGRLLEASRIETT